MRSLARRGVRAHPSACSRWLASERAKGNHALGGLLSCESPPLALVIPDVPTLTLPCRAAGCDLT